MASLKAEAAANIVNRDYLPTKLR